MKLMLSLTVACAILPFTSMAWDWESGDKWASWENGGYYVANDVWGSGAGPENIMADSYSHWQVDSDQTGPGIKSYPHVELDNINVQLSSIDTLTSSFNATTPSQVVGYDLAYDIWLGTNQYEVMVWQNWTNANPVAIGYNGNGSPIATYTNVAIDGITYNVYTGIGGSGVPCMSFLPTTQKNSDTVNLKLILQWISRTGWYGDETLDSVQFGWEIRNTGDIWLNFTMNSYSVTNN